MRKKYLNSCSLLEECKVYILALFIAFIPYTMPRCDCYNTSEVVSAPEVSAQVEETVQPEPEAEIASTDESVEEPTKVEAINKTEKLPASKKPTLSQKDIELIALVTMAEAEGESEKGKRLVIDTILNRMDHPSWPDTAYGVIYQKGQFTSMWTDRVKKCYVREDICQLVREELESRTNSKVVFFRKYNYGPYGTPFDKVGNHYFSSY